jgi:hypothetical protein
LAPIAVLCFDGFCPRSPRGVLVQGTSARTESTERKPSELWCAELRSLNGLKPIAADIPNITFTTMTLSAAQLIPINWVDGLLAGFLVVSLQHWLVRLYSLPDDLVWVIGIANLNYGCV